MRATCLAASISLLTLSCAYAQAPGFDMSGEGGVRRAPASPAMPSPAAPSPAAPSTATPRPAAPPPVAPPVAPPAGQPSAVPGEAAEFGPQNPAAPSLSLPGQAAPQQAPAANATASGMPPRGDFRRYVIPSSSLTLEGERDTHSWSIYVTPEQASSPARLNLGYQNAVVVAPEASKISVLINGRVIGQQPVSSSEGASQISLPIPPGLLQSGVNLVSLRSDQRHRTDCSIGSTYELWSAIDPANTFISFASPVAGRLSSVDAIRAIGVDETGATTFNMLVPALDQPGTTKPLLRLTQGLSVLSGMPSQKFDFQTDRLTPSGSGKLNVLVGTAAELQPLFPNLPPAAATAPIATFVDDRRTGLPVFVVSGPSWQSIAVAIDAVVSPVDRALDVQRTVLSTQRWSAPDAPMLFSDARLSFSQLGVETLEFSGRRFRSGFNIGVPADFYAQGYGEATILLDAAYDPSVLPGSHIDIYVNGSIASTVPITTAGGGIFRHLPIRVTMRHFRPGANTVQLETVLMTREDEVCAPGASASAAPRFALFDTSEFHMPDFARIGQRPNLSAMVGTGNPYGRDTESVPLFMDRVDRDTLSAAATLLSRMALMAGRPVAVEPVASVNAVGDRDALFVGAITQMPMLTLTQSNIANASQAGWRPTASASVENVDTVEVLDQWRSRVAGGGWMSRFASFQEWMRRNFDISLSSFRLLPGAEEPFAPSNAATFMIAQGLSPDGSGSWTVVTAPSSADLADGAKVMASQEFWPQISGRITTYSSKTEKVENVAVGNVTFMAPADTSFSNYRLIAANWLSTNILYYAVLFVALTALIGMTTAALLSNIGRRK